MFTQDVHQLATISLAVGIVSVFSALFVRKRFIQVLLVLVFVASFSYLQYLVPQMRRTIIHPVEVIKVYELEDVEVATRTGETPEVDLSLYNVAVVAGSKKIFAQTETAYEGGTIRTPNSTITIDDVRQDSKVMRPTFKRIMRRTDTIEEFPIEKMTSVLDYSLVLYLPYPSNFRGTTEAE